MIETIRVLKDYLFLHIIIQQAGNDQVSIDDYKKYFLPRVKIENDNIEIDGRNFYDQPIKDPVKQYDEIRKTSTRQSDDYTTAYLLDFAYFENSYRLSAVDLSKQRALEADPRAFQQIIFTFKVSRAVIIYCILEKSKETILDFSKETTKVL